MATLKDVKQRIGLTDDLQDDQLAIILKNTEAELLTLLPLGQISIPAQLDWVVVEVATKRYNRIGSEGMDSMSVDGLSNTFSNNDFDPYLRSIDNLFPRTAKSVKGSARFY
ncbi:phage head-tail connector protein [Staphylococcus chromogenes]|uniref:phage head-tail connector protein n=1 Tax=Staphylococcus chromogenes TaxID=46126 RepID=UPI003D7ACD21